MTSSEPSPEEMLLRIMRVAELLASSEMPKLDMNEDCETKTQDTERDVQCDENQKQ